MKANWGRTVVTAASIAIIGAGAGLGVYAGVVGFTSANPVATVAASRQPAVAHKIVQASALAQTTAVARRTSHKPGAPYIVKTQILTGAMDHRNGPAYSPAFFRLPAHATIRMTVRSFDDGAAPTPGYTAIRGTIGNAILVNGRTVHQVAASDIAHTFTVAALGLSVPIPAAPRGRAVTVTFTFHTGAAGTYTWQCYAQCGNGPSGWGFPMTTKGMMTGTVTVS